MSRKLSVVLIVPNSNHFLPIIISSLSSELGTAGCDWEIIVVGDADPKVQDYLDKTISQAAKIKFYDYPVNLPYHQAFSYAFYKTCGNLVCYLDPDLDLPGLNIRTLLAYLDQDGADYAIGSKFHPHSQTNHPFSHKLVGYIFALINRFLFNLSLKESNLKIKIFKRAVLEASVPRLTGKLQAFHPELLVVSHHLGFALTEAPVTCRQIVNSKIAWHQFWQFAKDLIAIFVNLAILRTYDRPEARKKLLIGAQQLAV